LFASTEAQLVAPSPSLANTEVTGPPAADRHHDPSARKGVIVALTVLGTLLLLAVVVVLLRRRRRQAARVAVERTCWTSSLGPASTTHEVEVDAVALDDDAKPPSRASAGVLTISARTRSSAGATSIASDAMTVQLPPSPRSGTSLAASGTTATGVATPGHVPSLVLELPPPSPARSLPPFSNFTASGGGLFATW
jgi:hypothetical protein